MMKASRSISAPKATEVLADDSKRKDKNAGSLASDAGSRGAPDKKSDEKSGSRLDKATSAVNFASSLVNAGTKSYTAHQTLSDGLHKANKPEQENVTFGSSDERAELQSPAVSQVSADQKSGSLAAFADLLTQLRSTATRLLDDISAKPVPQVAINRHDTPPPPEKEYPGVVNADGSIIETEKDLSDKPTDASGRPRGDTRTAEQIIDANPILKNLGDQKDIKRTEAYARIGDWTQNNADPKARADAAYNAAKVLNWINSSDQADGAPRQCTNDSDLQGITHDGDARHGTEAGNWKDFVEQGYAALKGDHRLDKANDSHVRPDGSNKDNFQAFAGEAGKKLWPLPAASNVLVAVGDSKGGLTGALKAGAGAAAQTGIAAAEGAAGGVKGGRASSASVVALGAAGAMSESQAAPDSVKTIAGMV
ncbi:hypothetical protein ALP72_03433 [Pseudomonas coronafaciens pv. coronafaciens]|nr:hypothetical protein ALP72_03433 [Pseudomonas coronafaciens pv. coronafaciens]